MSTLHGPKAAAPETHPAPECLYFFPVKQDRSIHPERNHTLCATKMCKNGQLQSFTFITKHNCIYIRVANKTMLQVLQPLHAYHMFICLWLARMWWQLTWTNLVRRRSICIRISSHASHIQVRERRRYYETDNETNRTNVCFCAQ